MSAANAVLDWPRRYGWDSAHLYAEDGTRLRLVVGGARGGRRVVLVHGFPQFSYAWRHVMERLADRYRVIAPDLRGYGASDLAASGRYDLPALASDLERVAAFARDEDHAPGRGGEAPILVAHDWGGPIGWHLLSEHPESARLFVAVNAPHPAAMVRELAHARQALRSWYIAMFQIPGLERLIELRRASLFLWMMRASCRPGVFADEELETYRAAFSAEGRAQAALAYYRQSFGRAPGSRGGSLVADLLERRRAVLASRRVETPVTIVWGEKDLALTASHPESTRPYATRLEIRTLPHVSHWVPEEAPDEVVRAVVEGDQSL